MHKVVNLIDEALYTKRRLTDSEMLSIIKELLEYYQIANYVNDIILDYHNQYLELAGFDPLNKTLYFNMNIINLQIFYQYQGNQNNDKNIIDFNTFYIIQQLSLILHEIRHIIQQNDSFKGKEFLKQIVLDSDINLYTNDIYMRYYDLFPVEKDAKIFSIDESIKLISKCSELNIGYLKTLYMFYIHSLINGYSLEQNYYGSLRDFYLNVFQDENRYLKYQQKSVSLSTHDKMSFNFSLEEDDLRKLILATDLAKRGESPEIVLKKVPKGKW